MSFSEYFSKKSKAALLATTVGLAGACGIAGLEVSQAVRQPSLSNLTMNQLDQETFEGKKSEAARLKEVAPDPMRETMLVKFTGEIDRLELDAAAQKKTEDDMLRIRERAGNAVITADYEAVINLSRANISALEAMRKSRAERLITEARVSDDITEVDYKNLIADFEKRARVSVPAELENYKEGMNWRQECVAITGIFGMFADDEPEVISADVGACMAALPDVYMKTDLLGAAGGAAFGGLLMLPAWRRRRPSGPKAT